MHAAIVLLVLVLTYLGMAAGRIAWLRVDRTGIALLAVIALLASSQMTLDDFGSAVDMPTLALFALFVVFAVVWLQWRRRIRDAIPPEGREPVPVTAHPLDRNQMIKGVVALIALLTLFSTSLPREIGALIIAALLLANRKITSRTMIAAVDWPLLLLVACLFAITGALNDAALAARALGFLDEYGLLPNNLLLLVPFAVVTSNAIGSLPAAMLLLQIWPTPPPGVLYSLALLSTLAGNLLLSGSLTNLLIAELADRIRAYLSYRVHSQVGVT